MKNFGLFLTLSLLLVPGLSAMEAPKEALERTAAEAKDEESVHPITALTAEQSEAATKKIARLGV